MENYKLEILKSIINDNIKKKYKYESIRSYLAEILLDEYKAKKIKDDYKYFYRYMNNYTLGSLNKSKDILASEQIYMEKLIEYSMHTIDMLKYYNGYIIRKIIEKNNIPKELFYNILKYIF